MLQLVFKHEMLPFLYSAQMIWSWCFENHPLSWKGIFPLKDGAFSSLRSWKSPVSYNTEGMFFFPETFSHSCDKHCHSESSLFSLCFLFDSRLLSISKLYFPRIKEIRIFDLQLSLQNCLEGELINGSSKPGCIFNEARNFFW